MDVKVLSWDDVERACKVISNVMITRKIDLIVPITRGGLVPSVIISELLNVHDISPIRISTRHKKVPIWTDKRKWQQLVNTNMNILVVDDIVDTGSTFDILMGVERNPRSLSKVYLSSLVLNTSAKPVNYDLNRVIHSITNNLGIDDEHTWFVFPWDKK